jgi:hypothetical protein
MNPSLQGDGGVCVTKIVRQDAAEASKPDVPVELLAEALRVQGRAVFASEDKLGFSPTRAECKPLLELDAAPLAQRDHRRPIDGDLPYAFSRLGHGFVNLAAECDQRPTHSESLLVAVNIVPLQSKDLAPSHAGVGGRLPHRVQPV